MTTDQIAALLGDGWLGKAVGGLFMMVFGAGGLVIGHERGRARERADVVHSLVLAADVVIKSRGDEITRQGAEIAVLRADLARCDERHDACERRVDALTAQIETLMTGRGGD